ncbi:cpr7p [Saccharomyces arboricola H-6]|uniref:peptidylprolyl isomerase n=1 Tax=Saccharomyces arboricola (strain H-6 / AS 2.3317 / CBS 10644) TaxID=1160507 RepID=J8Q073_SACAR|nr:cpr7p [Saccharomyces arboricola H-6]
MAEDSEVYLDISIDGKPIGRIVCKLFREKAPKTAENFYRLCAGDVKSPLKDQQWLSYKGNSFHRVIKNFMIQAGDIVHAAQKGSSASLIGKGGCSIYVDEEGVNMDRESSCYGNYEDENLGEFSEPFTLGMANLGSPNTNNSQFFITTYAAPHLNGKHSVFGQVIHGKSVVRTVEHSKVDSDEVPESDIRISDCGVWDESKGVPLYNASNDPIGGDVYEEYPSDDTHFNEDDFGEALKAANIIKESGTVLFKKKDFTNAFFKYRKSLNYINEYTPEPDVDREKNEQFTVLKMKVYLNLSLVLFHLEEYDNSITYATYLLEMDNVPDKDQAKAHYRRGNNYLKKNRFDEALLDYRLCKEKNPDDKVVKQRIEYVENLIEKKKEKTRKNISKFFS